MHTTHIHMYEATNKQKTSGRDSNQTVNSSHIGWEVGWDRASLEEEEGCQH